MKKFYISLLAALAIAPAAMAQTPANMLWGNLIAGSKNNIAIDFARASDGNLFYLNGVGSSTVTQVTNLYNGTTTQQIASGSVYSGTSYNTGISLMKTDANGNLLWYVWSDAGELYSNNGGVVPTADGGATVVLKLRHSQNFATTPIHLVSSNGGEFTYNWVLEEATSSRYYKGCVLHFDAQGNVEWLQVIDIDTTPQAAATSASYQALTPDAWTVNTVTSDSEGNIYLAGYFRNPVTFPGVNSNITITPRNTKGWNGDPQKSVGDLYIAKMSANGYVQKVFTTTGDTITNETVTAIKAEGSHIYIQGSMTGKEDVNVNFGGVTLNPNASVNLLVARLDTDLNVEWVRALPSAYTSAIYQKSQLNEVDGKLYLTGKFRTNITDGDITFNNSTLTRDGALMVFDSQTGTLQQAVANGVNMTGFYGTFTMDGDDENLYVYGHGTTAPNNLLFMQKRNKATLELVETYNLGTNTTGDIYPAVISGDTIYANARYAKNNVFFEDTENSVTISGYTVYMAAYKLPVVGDLDGSGVVDITDVNLEVNVVLGVADAADYNGAADVNGDGVIDISDVNALINLMLGK